MPAGSLYRHVALLTRAGVLQVVGGNAIERMHHTVWVLVILAVICAVGVTWADQERKSRRAARGTGSRVQRRDGRIAVLPGHDQRTL